MVLIVSKAGLRAARIPLIKTHPSLVYYISSGLTLALTRLLPRTSEGYELLCSTMYTHSTTGSPSSKYEHRRVSALLRNIQNIRICMGKKPIVSLTYENERISIKNILPYLKCVSRLSCVVHVQKERKPFT